MWAGESFFDKANDSDILKINSPKNKVRGPYAVVYKNTTSKWALCALHWENKLQLGIRYFWGKAGMPVSRWHSTWLVVPTELTTTILNGLPLDAKFRSKIDDFLSGKIDGKDLIKNGV
jgi:hypothetical protein